MEKGIVIWFNHQKGYGFIQGDNGEQYFVHYTNIISDDKFKTLTGDCKVKFEASKDGDGKNRAINVERIE